MQNTRYKIPSTLTRNRAGPVRIRRRANAEGDFHFKYITHTLACQECINSGVAQRCIHNLGNLPGWKSIMKLAQIKRIYPKKQQREFETEVLGMLEGTRQRDTSTRSSSTPSRRRKGSSQSTENGSQKCRSGKTPSATEGRKWGSRQSHTPQGEKRSFLGAAAVPNTKANAGRGQGPQSTCFWGNSGTTEAQKWQSLSQS